MTKFKSSIILILFTSFLLITTCTTDNSITGNSDQALSKITNIVDINSPMHDDAKCLFTSSGIPIYIPPKLTNPLNNLSVPYDFRDNFLGNSKKGIVYRNMYYELSKYGIENNLVNKYYKEHYDLLKNGIEIAYALQHGSNTNSIMINKSTRDDLKDMLGLYSNSPNHREIEPVLDYLEKDLEKYSNKPKSEIVRDFQ